MKILIDIPKGIYEMFLSGDYPKFYACDVADILRNGTPIPKDHEDLIERIQNLPTQESVDGQDMLQAYDVIRTIKEYYGGYEYANRN